MCVFDSQARIVFVEFLLKYLCATPVASDKQ